LPQYLRLEQHPVSVTVDDHTARIEGTKTLYPHQCDSTAYLLSTRAIGPRATSAAFNFVPPSSGCYRVDEFHPESQRYCFLGGADLTIEHCLGKTWQGSISLRKDGAQWNTVGHFPFFAGVLGKVTSRAKAGSNPAEWVADAFRFTKVSDSCSKLPYSALMTLRLIGIDLTDVKLPDGQLTTNTDQRLAFHEAVADVADLPDSQVRLLGLRAGSIIAEFEIQGKEEEVTGAVKKVEVALWKHGPGSLEDRLCEAATIGGTVMPCRVWLIRTTAYEGSEVQAFEDDKAEHLPWPVWAWIAVGFAFFVPKCMLVMVVAFICMKRRRRGEEARSFMNGQEDDPEATSKDAKDNISDSASTATPDRVNCHVQTEMTGEIFDLDAMSNFDPQTEDDMINRVAPDADSPSNV
jgi:hypothetical protein